MKKLIFQDKNQAYCVDIPQPVYECMLSYCNSANPCETGGVLIGNYSTNNKVAHICQATPAPLNSSKSRCSFLRSSNGLKKLLDDVWEQGQYYLGEWHYHPNSSSEPSGIDKRQMRNLSLNESLNCPEPILIIIGGCKDNWNTDVRVYVKELEVILDKQP